MATKTLTITEEAYSKLANLKREKESFSDIINKLTRKESLLDLVGTISSEEANELKKHSTELRKRLRRQMK